MTEPNVLCVIPAGTNSTGAARRTFAAAAELSLVADVVEQARASNSVSRVVVATDDKEIAVAAARSGAEVLPRPAALDGDQDGSEAALLYVLETLEQTEGYRPELLACVQCTAPSSTAADIDGTIRTLLELGADSALAVVPSHLSLWRRASDGSAAAINHDPAVCRRQNREAEFMEAGSVYVMRVGGFRLSRYRFFGKTALHVLPRDRLLDVRDPTDPLRVQVGLAERARRERLALLPERPAVLALDFDGVMTDNRVLLSADGTESVVCDRGDGMGIERLRRAGLPVAVFSNETDPVVGVRCAKLRIPCFQGLDDKGAALRSWLAEQGIDPANAVFLGNDVNDGACLRSVGCGVVVGDAHPAVRPYARFELEARGGHGAVRELTDLIEARLGLA